MKTTTLMLIHSESSEDSVDSKFNSAELIVVDCNKNSVLYPVRGRNIGSVILKGMSFKELSETARKTIINASAVNRLNGKKIPLLELDVDDNIVSHLSCITMI
jgi:hypothetical protein